MQLKPSLILALMVLLASNLPAAENEKDRQNRGDSIRALCQRLGVGPGAVVADVGCGDGPDTMVFADIVGEGGTVLAQEIDANKLKKVVETADKRGFHQVVPVLGQSDDPRLPNGAADVIYMNRVFHHFARPEAMLHRMRADLKPGGYLVIVDQQEGPLTDWTQTEKREKEHHWTAETTVVRLAREAGFLFHDLLDDLWHEQPPFVLAFRRPPGATRPDGEPDLPQPLDVDALIRVLPERPAAKGAVAFCGLDRGRATFPAIRATWPASTRFYDIILNEWALAREELPPDSQADGVEVLRTEKAELNLPDQVSFDAILFVDAYHRLWEPLPILKQLGAVLSDSGFLAVVDRQGPDDETRRLAGHRRRIAPERVIQEMREAGFELRERLEAPAADRFFLLFGPASSPAP
jgi:SAM-dependent methyltransferase